MGTQEIIAQSIKDVPALSPSASSIIRLIAQEEYEFEEIIDLVRMDSGLTSRILRLVNSPAYGLMKPVQSIERAVVFLGSQAVVSLALVNLNAQLLEKELQGYHSGRGVFWKHELRTALAARQVARVADIGVTPDLAFTAGLLHDIGKVAISQYQIQTGQDLMPYVVADQDADYLELERFHLGTDHCAVGGEIARQWNLPGSLETSIQYHHEPCKAPSGYRPLVYMIHLGDVLAMMSGWGTEVDSLKYTLDEGYAAYFSLSFDQIALIMMEVDEEFRQLEEAEAGPEA
ncbi:MAG: HDOD domain-containing protein [Thermodesulfobacteriota bacterium]